MTQVITPVNHIRRHDIDWLRTLAFGLLILYHVGMYYVADWGWHVKSNNQSILLQDFMILTNQWRMSLLFFISGIALSLVVLQSRLSRKHLAGLRLNRLIVPLIFSMCFIVPPQLFYELQQHGLTMNYWAFLQEYWNVNTTLAPFKQSAIGLLTWNHLWFLPYLFIYSLLVLILFPLYSFVGKGLQTRGLSLWWFMGLIILSMAFIWAHLRESFPITNALVDDWYNHAKYFLYSV
ncbi:acyltransferase family protein [Shewanella sp. HN-41]|uniref:acyltransferase family protein n=1 Tax=Shewanella sp. HN-41 TaxID=327275 RepID=UPI000681BFAA|nr:acyltransferase family protein [Shewanella sp. HN-41]